MKKLLSLILIFAMITAAFTSCGKNGAGKGNKSITVISREEGSGTRDGFTEIFGIKENSRDNTTAAAEIASSTSVVINTVAGNKNAIGYISLGSLNDQIKAVRIDGAEASASNIKEGRYNAVRPFSLAVKTGISGPAADFIAFVTSMEGQQIISGEGYIPNAENPERYVKHNGLSGRIVIAGSTSVAHVMEVLADAYKEMYENVEIEVQQTGSGAGIISAAEGACDIGMISRVLKDEEKEKGIEQTDIALDGIAVIVNKENGAADLTSEEIKNIFTGEITEWE